MKKKIWIYNYWHSNNVLIDRSPGNGKKPVPQVEEREGGGVKARVQDGGRRSAEVGVVKREGKHSRNIKRESERHETKRERGGDFRFCTWALVIQ